MAVSQMDQVTQQNAAMVEESTAASRNLASETSELVQRVSFFRVGEDGVGSAHTLRSPASHSTERALDKSGSFKPAATKPVLVRRRRSSGALALAATPQGREEEWQDF